MMQQDGERQYGRLNELAAPPRQTGGGCLTVIRNGVLMAGVGLIAMALLCLGFYVVAGDDEADTSDGNTSSRDNFNGYAIGDTGCEWLLTSTRGAWDFGLAISGPKREQAWVDVGIERGVAYEVRAQYHKTFSDTDRPFIHQTYAYDADWRTSWTYTVRATVGSLSGEATFKFPTEADYTMHVYCE